MNRFVQRAMAPLERRMQNFLARGTVALSNAAAKMQTLQVNLLADETLDGIEHFEPYGLTSRPKPGAEVAALFIDGDRSHGIVIVVADRRYRIKGLEEGEVALYDDQGQCIAIKRDGIVIDCAGKPLAIINCPSFTHDGVNVGNTHAHGNVESGSDNTGGPH